LYASSSKTTFASMDMMELTSLRLLRFKKKNPSCEEAITGCTTLMWDAFCLEGQKSQDLLHGAAWFAFGVALAACGWFSATTAIEGLRELVPPETALFAAIGLQAGVVSSAYFFAQLTRRRIYWLGAYLLIRRHCCRLLILGNTPVARGRRQPAAGRRTGQTSVAGTPHS
jgi:hypothetical protein